MKRRITLAHKPEHGIDPAAVRLIDGTISGPEVLAAKQERLVFSPDELPDEVAIPLSRCPGQLHVRWGASSSYESPELLSSRVSPGLHVFYSPTEKPEDKLTLLCSSLELFFGGLECSDPASFIKLPSTDGDGRSDTFQYYQTYEPDHLISRLESILCASRPDDDECSARVRALRDAVSVDIFYDTKQDILRLEALWASDRFTVGVKPVNGHRTEIGILATDPSGGEVHELGVGGFLISTPDEKKEPSLLAFTVPSRHRRANGSFSAKFLSPHGLHPTLQLAVSSATPPVGFEDQGGCSLHAYLTLPKTIFADRYQLADDLFMLSKNLSSLRYASHPVDLEMPAYKTPAWGSTVLLDLAPPPAPGTSTDEPSAWTAEVPLHLRYMAPAQGGFSETQVPYPVVFWTCRAAEDTTFSVSPWDRASLGYDALFEPRTVFWHVEPHPETTGDGLVMKTEVPVLATEKSGWVEIGTAGTILIGFVWVLYSLFSAARGVTTPTAPSPTWVIFKYRSTNVHRVTFQKIRLDKLPLGGNPITPWTYILGNDGHLGEIAWVEDGYFTRDASLPMNEPTEPWIDSVVPYELANDGRLLVWTPAMMLCPSIDELPGVMGWLHRGLLSGKKIKAGGSFHAWSNIAVTDGIQIVPWNLKLLTRATEEVPPVYKQNAKFEHHLLIRGGSGNTLRELNQYAWEQGLGFPALGGFDGQTIGGMFNTGTHGSVLTTSHLVDAIVSLDLIQATGKLIRIEPADGITDPAAFAAECGCNDARLTQDDGYFNAVLINMGTMGVVASYVLKLTPRYHLKEVRTQSSISEVKEKLSGGKIYSLSSVAASHPPSQIAQTPPRISDGSDGGFRGHPYPAYHFELLINPHGTKVVITTRHPLPVDDSADAKMHFQPPGRDLIRTLQRGARFSRSRIPTWFQERFGLLLVTIVDTLIALLPPLVPRLNDTAMASLMREAYIDRSFNVFNIGPGTNDIPALACSIFVPVENDAYLIALDTIQKTAGEFAAKGMYNTAPLAMRFVKGSRAFLGIREDSCSFEFIFTARTAHAQRVIDGYDAALRDALSSFFHDAEDTEKHIDGAAEGKHRVRVHWGQMMREPDAKTLMGMYPLYPRWREIRDELDPGEVFLNQWQARVLPKAGAVGDV
ncbi:uncharacterized protein DNG_05490 [Cephalotrichum gorgonifer]|uniref:Protein PBN1 n=1 Tax=Cephalotrichum gorgonifer TaxID=2041049 RepID=A0AAE8N0T6_9PEZI|nr:uncharacterized protein DNG_05490 [Cephalotrichum gorgonifer]